MRILLISATYPPDPGGVATHVTNLANALVGNFGDMVVHVLTLRKPGEPFKKDVKGKVVEWKLDRRMADEFSGRRVAFERLVEFAFQNWHQVQPDLLHAHDNDAVQVGWMLRTAFRVPLVFSVHRAPSPWRPGRLQLNAKDCFLEALRLHGCVDALVVPSETSREVLEQQGFRGVKVIRHAVSKYLASFPSDPKLLEGLGIPAGADLVFCPVRADEHKDPDTFVRGAAALRELLPERRLFFLVASDGADRGEEAAHAAALRGIALSRGLDVGRDIVFTRPLPYGVPLATVYRTARAVVIPSLRESFGQTVLDAFLFERPVVVRDTPALREIVTDNVTGLLFSTSKELASQLRKLLEDETTAARLGKEGRRELERTYPLERMAAQYRALYEQTIREWGPPRE